MNAAEFEDQALPHAPALLALARRLTRDAADAEDLVQEALVKAFRSRSQFRQGSNLRAWLLTIVRNTFLNSYRRQALQRRTLEGPESEDLLGTAMGADSLRAMRDAETSALHKLLEQPLARALDELPEDFRTVVHLSDVEELSYREIAEMLGCPMGTVMSRLHRGRKLLRSQLVEQAQALGLLSRQSSMEAESATPSSSGEAEGGQAVLLSKYRAKSANGSRTS